MRIIYQKVQSQGCRWTNNKNLCIKGCWNQDLANKFKEQTNYKPGKINKKDKNDKVKNNKTIKIINEI